MTEDSNDSENFTDLSDEEIQDLSQEFTEAVPEALGRTLGLDLFSGARASEPDEFEEEFSERIAGFLTGFRDAMAAESEDETVMAIFDLQSDVIEQYMMEPDDRQEFDSGLTFITEQLRSSLEVNREGMKELGHANYFDLLDEFAKEIVEAGQAGDVKEFFDGLENGSQQMMLQRLFNPVLTEYYDYLEEHSEISSANEARQYADMYHKLAELVGDILPQFIAVLQIVSGREETYEALSKMGLNNLLQKLQSKKFNRFNELADGIDRELRNSIVHGEFIVNPIENRIEFFDRGDPVAELDYSEFQDEVLRLLALFNALWVFRLMLMYYRVRHLPEVVENLREANSSE
ncbi:hypothetical protein ACFO0N_15200 [Halobium salinum]|uniref:Apea-like HEPN domain-containing protein n=1 Tax=Halobium salinum TaxID=1364940 RepID=A0ABD5PF46_9EURY|nr:hypothetical protein [Halobium salinum]